jgi:ATP-dependent DNA helicase RecG
MGIVDPVRLLLSLIALPRETEWLEFKQNRFSAEEFGRYVSALANAAILHDQPYGYLIYGIENETHAVVGTSVRLKEEKIGPTEPFEVWLAKLLHPEILVEFVAFECRGKHVELVRVHPGYMMPVRFKTEAYIRVDSALKPLRELPGREQAVWAICSRFTFERSVAVAHLDEAEVFDLFDPDGLLKGLGAPQGLSRQAAIQRLVDEELLIDNLQGGWDATNLLAILGARDITRFRPLEKKMPRVIHYKGTSKATGIDDVPGRQGYGLSFGRMLQFVMDRIEHKEEMLHGQRTTVYAIPLIAMREFIANALIHQDMTAHGAGPTIEIFSDRVKITNPGRSLVDPHRLIDAAPRSRNEALAGFMRRLGHFEGRGSGVDRAVEAIEKAALTPPLFQVTEDSFVATAYAARSFAAMTKEDRIRACYQHASVRWEASIPMSNQSLRLRFGLGERQYPQVSNVIRDTIDAGLIRPQDEDQANRIARYVPHWV